MNDRAVAKRYAEGFLSFAKDTIGAKKGLEELICLGRLFGSNPEFLRFLKNPEITYAEKAGFIDETFADTFSEETRELIKLVVEKRRSEEAANIADEAKELYYREMGIEKTLIKSARPLPREMLNAIEERLEKKLNKKLEVEVRIDPALIGGVQAIIGHIVVDGSIKRKLAELKEHLLETKVD